jgi:hypothetical protein
VISNKDDNPVAATAKACGKISSNKTTNVSINNSE